jgi:hypothetical protein
MPQIKILKTTKCGGELVKAGDVIDASAKDTKILVEMGKAELAGADKEAAEAENRDDIELTKRGGAPRAKMTTKSAKALK